MSLDAVRVVLMRAVSDPEFRACFFRDPDGALARYNLTNEERASLEEIESEDQLTCIYQQAEEESGTIFADTRI